MMVVFKMLENCTDELLLFSLSCSLCVRGVRGLLQRGHAAILGGCRGGLGGSGGGRAVGVGGLHGGAGAVLAARGPAGGAAAATKGGRGGGGHPGAAAGHPEGEGAGRAAREGHEVRRDLKLFLSDLKYVLAKGRKNNWCFSSFLSISTGKCQISSHFIRDARR